jgi:hypothetical protein
MSKTPRIAVRIAPVIDEARIVSDLDTILTGAKETGACAPAIRAAELLGRHIGMWRSDAQPQESLADLIRDAAANAGKPDRDPPRRE